MDDITVTEEWFIPHFEPRDHNPREKIMLKAWKEYMSYEKEHSCGWCTRLEAFLRSIPRACTLRGGRMAVTCAVWFMTPVGLSVLAEVLAKAKQDSFLLESDVVAVWAMHNRLNDCTRNYLEHLLRPAGAHLYDDPPYPTMEDNRVVEAVLIFFAKEEGRGLLRRVCKKAKQPDLLPL